MENNNGSTTNELVDSILKGDHVVKKSFGKIIYATMCLSGVYQEINSAKTNMERVLAIGDKFPSDEFEEILQTVNNLLTKNDDTAKALKLKAEMFSKNLNFNMALRSYNLALSFTPITNLELLVELYKRRAILLLAMFDIEGALKDIEIALALNPNYPILLDLKMIKEEIERQNSETETTGSSQIDLQREYRDNIMLKIHGETYPECSSVGDYICVQSNEATGRYLTVNKELKPGTTVLVEDPFVSVLFDILKWEMKHCTKCFKKIRAPFPCPNCVFVVYCGEKCQEADFQDGHRYECICYPFLHTIKASRNLQLSLKAICKVGSENLYKLYNGSKEIESPDKIYTVLNGGQPICEIFNMEPYHRVLNLISHFEHSDIPMTTWLTISLVYILDKKTDFFNSITTTTIDKNDKINFLRFISSIILHHSLSFQYNTRALYEEVEIKNITEHFKRNRNYDKQIASGVYTLTNLMNHSCSSNIIKEKLSNGQIAIITNKKMYPGDELLDTYGFEFLQHTIAERRTGLLMDYCFHCNCIACTYDWPKYQELTMDLKFICINCNEKSNHINNNNNNTSTSCFKNIFNYILIINGNEGTCNECKNIYQINILKQQVTKYEEIMSDADNQIMNGKPLEAITILIDCIEFFQKMLCPPSLHLIMAQGTLAEAYELILGTSGH